MRFFTGSLRLNTNINRMITLAAVATGRQTFIIVAEDNLPMAKGINTLISPRSGIFANSIMFHPKVSYAGSVRSAFSCYSSDSKSGWMTSIATSDLCMTSSVMLPCKNRLIPFRPWVAIAIRSHPLRFAILASREAGGPVSMS